MAAVPAGVVAGGASGGALAGIGAGLAKYGPKILNTGLNIFKGNSGNLGDILGGSKSKWAPLAMSGLNILGTVMGNKNQQAQKNAAYDAYNSYINQIQKQREAAKQYMQGNYEAGEKQFFGEANKPLQEIEQVAQDIGQAGTEQQQEYAKQMASNLASQGVRGGQASTLLGRGAGQLSREALRDVNQLRAQEAMGRQEARLGYTAKKGLIPYNTLNTAEWLHLPTASEQAMMARAVNAKFGV